MHRYRREFGDNHLFTLLAVQVDERSRQRVLLPVGYVAFGNDITYTGPAGALSTGAEIRETSSTESFDFDDYYRNYDKRATAVFTIDAKGRRSFTSADEPNKPGPQWIVSSLIEPQGDKQSKSGEEPNESAAG